MSSSKRLRFAESAEPDTDGTWAISYGDMITLLLTFFILFFSIDSSKDREKRLSQALLDALLPLQTSTAGRDPASLTSGMPAGSKLDWPGAIVERDGSRVIVRFPGTSFFGTADTRLTRRGESALRNFVPRFLPYAGQHRIVVRAFSDERRIKPHASLRFQDNLELSALRSVAAMRVLQHAGIPLDRLRVGGYGELSLSQIDAPKGQPRLQSLSLARTVALIIEPEAK